ncbi:MAG: hypothetical protein CMK07_15525 [Ponticaulis sp.]|nr:hypothetical protein [Ponticaulis sp.]
MTLRKTTLGFYCLTTALLSACGTGTAATSGLPPTFDTICLASPLDRECRVVASARSQMNDLPPIALQVQAGSSEQAGVGGGVVVYQDAGEGWEQLAASFDGYWYDYPTFADLEEGVLMHIAGVRPGTGSGNADLAFYALYAEEDAPLHSWQPVDITSWRDTIGEHLPEGLEIWKGVDFDMGDWTTRWLTASTYLWKAETDANCCPTGGRATIHFALEDNVIKIDHVEYDPTMPDEY